ncbi:uncharacterized protein LY89DRAFT_152017 [Mollisia scopiformis]|uniref:F-box domain-containing protein n=1 Tax=Mollisia scopiformis TaxID=149040 RepID=A0A194X207_MOLSC|nr:uncharacterized protein LY89DRAFT_152017 [Mollisia scopiformis]KUJ14024.1 hypothetical protein LY89DRAFT_152017 [Mollisia scopiformis]
MAPRLEDCPNEVIESIVVLLDLNDICNLRQTSRSLATKATQNHFKSFYLSKHVDTTTRSLEKFVDATRPGRLGCLVQNLTIFGVFTFPRVDGRDLAAGLWATGMKLDLLNQALSGIAAAKRTEETISLSRNGVDWESYWQCVAGTFHTAMRAVAASGLKLRALIVFHDTGGQSGNLGCDELNRLDFQDQRLVASLSSLKYLALSLSDRAITNLPEPDRSQPPKQEFILEAMGKATDQENFIGLEKLLQLAPLLEDLEIRYYRLNAAHVFLRSPYLQHELLLRELAQSEKLPRLKTCSIRGIVISSEDLLAFVRRTAPQRLLLDNVILSGGIFTPFFDHCTGETTGILEFEFKELFEKHNIVHFGEPGQGSFAQGLQQTGTNSSRTSTSLIRTGDGVKKPISYHYYHGVPMDTPQIREERRERQRLYGPLHR